MMYKISNVGSIRADVNTKYSENINVSVWRNAYFCRVCVLGGGGCVPFKQNIFFLSCVVGIRKHTLTVKFKWLSEDKQVV